MQANAVVIDNYGDSNEFHDALVEVPELKPKQLLLKVAGSSVAPFDISVRKGVFKDDFSLNMPAITGTDVVGEIVAKGSAVDQFDIGDIVCGMVGVKGFGAYADYAILGQSKAAKIPDNMAVEIAAVLPMTAIPAYNSLFDLGQLVPGEKVLIHGGAGGVGSMAIQLAKNAGATVYTTASPRNIDDLKKLGADRVLDYHTEKFEEELSNLDLVIDTVGHDTYKHSFEVLKSGGRLVSLVESPNEELADEYNVHAMYLSGKFDNPLSKVVELVAGKKIKLHVQKIFPLNAKGVKDAQDYYENNHVFGKVALIK
ncbi:zinc-containing alcohol dehydrogenase [Companilactobacillus nodensis DSM 19682 = JCM 14932 = NBRC 107160]|uniref:Zinc-containing alcohol dehydrogenase n=2 Tax=Companilactobacillus nodensis TaxID=460870 RepID=A0A0R1KAS1_9LACO|nr:NADP-dependent oxidoreductase [Companilactobacillus nodensis]KRK78531.1 zinc-containing alcohol dehydrogenase [Companilactobacillus nodensis DSM 19682 = JCM 14932 = NBRC 107160]